jgi:hypothetical protein
VITIDLNGVNPCPFSKPHPRLRISREVVRKVESSQFDLTAERS